MSFERGIGRSEDDRGVDPEAENRRVRALSSEVAEANLAKDLADKLLKAFHERAFGGWVPLDRHLTVSVIVDAMKVFQFQNHGVFVRLKHNDFDQNLLLAYFTEDK